jgi:hypothetical protein
MAGCACGRAGAARAIHPRRRGIPMGNRDKQKKEPKKPKQPKKP